MSSSSSCGEGFFFFLLLLLLPPPPPLAEVLVDVALGVLLEEVCVTLVAREGDADVELALLLLPPPSEDLTAWSALF